MNLRRKIVIFIFLTTVICLFITFFFLNNILFLGHSLNLKVVAEGVETIEQRTLLQQIGCDYIQGYFISKPLIFEDLLQFLNNQNN